MCDYSLMEFPNRLAVEGEVLLVHRFPSGSLGLASPADCTPKPAGKRSFWTAVKEMFTPPQAQRVCAVCIPPGARLILHDVPLRLQKKLAIGADEQVKFVQTSAAENFHRDAVCFQNGNTLQLQYLQAGQRVEVLDLGNAAAEEPGSFGTVEQVRVIVGGQRRG